jgi:hypothetical protein
VPPEWSSGSNDGICGRSRRIRIAWPFSSGSRLTSLTIAPPFSRIGATSIGLVESNTSQTVSARRNSAAGVGVPNESVTRSPTLSRRASTVAGFSLARLSAAGAEAAGVVFCAPWRGVAVFYLGVQSTKKREQLRVELNKRKRAMLVIDEALVAATIADVLPNSTSRRPYTT